MRLVVEIIPESQTDLLLTKNSYRPCRCVTPGISCKASHNADCRNLIIDIRRRATYLNGIFGDSVVKLSRIPDPDSTSSEEFWNNSGE